MKRTKRERQHTDNLKWYQRLSLFFFEKARITVVVWAALLMLGAGAYGFWLQREGFPEISVPVSTVSGTYFVNDREQVDEKITQPIAEIAQDVDGVTTVTSQANDNFFSMQVQFEEKIDSEEGNERIETAINKANVLPEDADVTFSPVYTSGLTMEGDNLLIAVASEELSAEELQQKAEFVASELGSEGSASVASAEEVRAVPFFETGANPLTGEEVTQQTKFDWTSEGESFTPSAIVAVKAADDMGDLELYDDVAAQLTHLQNREELNGVSVSISGDFATLIREQTSSLEQNMLGGLLAVALIGFLFISWRASIVSALSMITTLAFTVAGLYLFGESLNTITLFALILTLGLIVDDATIVIEAIDARRKKGEGARETIAYAIKKVAAASTAGTVTTILAFAPLLFIGGIMGDFIMAIPVTIIMSLVISLIVSLTLVPFLARFTVLRQKRGGKVRNPLVIAEAKIGRILSKTIQLVKTAPKAGVTIGAIAILISFGAIGLAMQYSSQLPFNIFPQTKDGNQLMLSLSYDANTSIDDAKERAAEVNNITEQTIGQYIDRASYYGTGSASSANATITLTPYQERDITAPELAEQLNAQLVKVEGVEAEANASGGPAPGGGFTMQVKNSDGQALTAGAEAIAEFLEGKEIERPDGTIAKIESTSLEGISSVARSDGERYAAISAEYNADDVSTLVMLTQEEIRAEFTDERLNEYGLSADDLVFDVGQEAENQESFNSMLIAFPILFLLMYILLAVQLRSFSQPLLIFLAVPFSLLGVTMGLFYTDNAFSFFVMLGIFALMGIAVNNTILLTDYANQARREGRGKVEAIASALQERFRPLIVTTLTTFVALVPLMLSDPFWESLAVTLAFGLVSSTILVIIAFPYYYLFVEQLRETFTRKLFFAWLLLLLIITIGLPLLGVAPFITLSITAAFIVITAVTTIRDIARGRRRRSLS